MPAREGDPRWQAIGQVNVGGYRTRSLCTGTLLAPRLVLTAAHCVVDPASGTPFTMDRIHFVAGVHRDRNSGHSMAKCVKFPKGYRFIGPDKLNADMPAQSVPIASFRQDLALIVLTDPITAAAYGVTDGTPLQAGKTVTLAGYAADRRYILSLHENCEVSTVIDTAVATNCDAHFGSSGGPLLVETDKGMRVAGVLAGSGSNLASFVSPLSNWPDFSLDTDCP